MLALFHLLKKADLRPDEVDFVVECSEEAAGDMNQRGGGNFAKAIAEIAGCVNASGLDVRAFCAAPVNALITGASLVASGARKNVVVLAGGALPKLFMNARDHVKKGLPALENCLGNFAVLLTPDDGTTPVIRLDALGKHSVGAGASPQAVTTAWCGTRCRRRVCSLPMWTSMRPSFTSPKSPSRPGPAMFPRPTRK